MNNEIMVSVEVLAYNHEKTIARALDSILDQKTSYSYEIVIGEDASTDKTADIVREYAEKYPDKIVPLIRENNLGIQDNAIDILRHCRGKYLAVCEGDDYWIFDDKLQKQIDYLENNADCCACVTKCRYLLNGVEQEYPFAREDSLNIKDMLQNGNVKRYATCTLVSRNIYIDEPDALEFFKTGGVGDIVAVTLYASRGSIHYMDFESGIYERITNENEKSFSSKSLEKQAKLINRAIDKCELITGQEYIGDWERYKATFNRAAFWEKDSIIKRIRFINSLPNREKKYLIQVLISDYWIEKKRK